MVNRDEMHAHAVHVVTMQQDRRCSWQEVRHHHQQPTRRCWCSANTAANIPALNPENITNSPPGCHSDVANAHGCGFSSETSAGVAHGPSGPPAWGKHLKAVTSLLAVCSLPVWRPSRVASYRSPWQRRVHFSAAAAPGWRLRLRTLVSQSGSVVQPSTA